MGCYLERWGLQCVHEVHEVKDMSSLITAQENMIQDYCRPHEFLHSVNKYLLSLHYVPGPGLDPWNTMKSEIQSLTSWNSWTRGSDRY